MAALRARGLVVQPFKCGPDFIDPGHHTRVCQRESRNIDTWMVCDEINRTTFHRHSAGADVSVVEGLMGLFDGAGADALDRAYQLDYVRNGAKETEGYVRSRMLASYIHIHFRSHPELAKTFVREAIKTPRSIANRTKERRES
jgi:cobyrinic acid a,c-diamide synthase